MSVVNELYDLLQQIEVTEANEDIIQEINEQIQEGNFRKALSMLKTLLNTEVINNEHQNLEEDERIDDEEILSEINFKNNDLIDNDDDNIDKGEEDELEDVYPSELINNNLEERFIGMLLCDPKTIAKYYIIYDECYFQNKTLLEIYKGIIFTEGEAYAPDIAKRNFNFGRNTFYVNKKKADLKEIYENQDLDMEKIYVEIKKLFVLRKNYLEMPIKSIQNSIVEITKYKLYNKMSEEEVKNAVNQVMITDKFKQSVLNSELTDFLLQGNNTLTSGLALPFRVLSSVFKGVRRGETMAFAMPSNAGKSRFTINLASYIAFIHKKKVLVISNEMSEEKMKLCLITTILNNVAYQDLHGKRIRKTEGELLEFKFRPDSKSDVELDKNGFILKREKETQKNFIKRLNKISSEFRKTIEVTDWVRNQTNNSIYFVNITDHTNDELQKIIMNYYYKEEIHYMFYDTLKTDTANIGNGEEIKKTATILSNLAQNFNLFIGSTLQLTESQILPINLTVNDLAVSRTVKEVLDTLCLIKQISRDNLADYVYSLKEVDTKVYELEKFDDPDVRYYACVVDKNRAGAKPKVLFRLNLAYNYWEELGYLSLKQKGDN